MSAIQDQVRLPMRVALGVVLQGIRIRFGRSLVTIMGVMFGVAFLMSILTGEVIKREVGEEERLRTEVRRMYSFLTSEVGHPEGRTIGVVQTGALNEMERRLIEMLGKEGVELVRWTQTGQGLPPVEVKNTTLEMVSLDEVGNEASGVVLVGEDMAPDIAWQEVLANSRQKVVAMARSGGTAAAEGVSVVQLAREMKEDEIAKLEKEKRKSKARARWIICVAVLVTIIGVTNAMLMSVTERFREIGTMKCLGALSSFVRQIFLLESSLVGLIGGTAGAVAGSLFSVCVYGITYGFGLVLGSLNMPLLFVYMALCIVGGIVLSVMAALYPASVASAMVPATALRSNV